jgi:hypothetical protein
LIKYFYHATGGDPDRRLVGYFDAETADDAIELAVNHRYKHMQIKTSRELQWYRSCLSAELVSSNDR